MAAIVDRYTARRSHSTKHGNTVPSRRSTAKASGRMEHGQLPWQQWRDAVGGRYWTESRTFVLRFRLEL